MGTRSLRLRLIAASLVSAVVALSVTYAALVLIYVRHIDRRVLAELGQRSIEVVGALAVDAAGAVTLDHALSDLRYGLPYGGAYWQVSADGKPILRSRSLWDKALATATPGGGPPRLTRESGPDGGELDVLARPVTLPGSMSGPLTVLVAFGRAEVEAQRQAFALDAGIALAILGVLLVAGAALQASFGLRPLDVVRTRLAAVHGGRAQTVDGPFPDEVAPLVRDLNGLFAAQRAQVVRAREQAGDLAHALKTPLTIVDGEALRLRQAGNEASSDLLRDQAAAMRRQVDRVLARARVRGLTATAAATSVGQTVDGLFAVMRRLPRGETLTWVSSIDPGLRVDMDRDDLGEVLGNLLDNARKWAASQIAVTGEADDGRLRIAVSDDGPGLGAEEGAGLMDRGRTGSDAVAGTGLGLSIVADLLEAYGARLTLGRDPDGRFQAAFTVYATPSDREPDV